MITMANPRKGLIPAHAGKTAGGRTRAASSRAHPRSRGENVSHASDAEVIWGSSPLTRGKRRRIMPGKRAPGLIPAHAGKTTSRPCRTWEPWAHPRSRGENASRDWPLIVALGSSPLTRGKLHDRRPAMTTAGLIPAHAGKTPTPRLSPPCSRAHPRSRGENNDPKSVSSILRGSSPLTRGKLHLRRKPVTGHGLIPAHAGKTNFAFCSSIAAAAHPRSRGENPDPRKFNEYRQGSSPLTRGKRDTGLASKARGGLIPAHAGKTRAQRSVRSPERAHPRSRGENTS